MSNKFGVEVITSETPQSAGTSNNTGTAFIVGVADSGPLTEPVRCTSVSAYEAAYGPRSTTSSTLFDAVETFFQLQGEQCYVQRAGHESEKVAVLVLKDSGAKPTITVSAKYAGTYGNTLKIEVVTKSGEYEINIQNEAGELLEGTGLLKNQAGALEYKSAYVTFTANKESEFTTNNPTTLASKALTGGVNPAKVEAANYGEALALFKKTLGPGTVLVPGQDSTTVHSAIGEHCSQKNRIGACDLADSSTVATLISEKGSPATGIASYLIYTSSSVKVQGLVPGTERTVPGSSVIAGLRAQVSETGNDNQAPAGAEWPLPSFVTGVTNLFSSSNVKTLNEAGINSWAERGGRLCLYGFSSALSKTVDKIYWQASAGCERMALVAAGEEIGERFLFKTIDGRKILLGKFQGELQAVIKTHWENGALFGENAPEAGKVNVGEPVNTLATIQAGELNAELEVRISPFAQSVTIRIVATPITQEV